jgi:LacI family transcriptional regulator
MAAAAVSVAHRKGLDVPRDLSVVGFDDTAPATTVWPELTTIRQPIAEMAEAAIEMLIGDLRGGNGGVSERVFPHELVTRGSSGAVPRRFSRANSGGNSVIDKPATSR